MNPEDLEVIREMADHLDYCGYGDSWERECAVYSKLPERVSALMEKLGLTE